MSGTFDPTSPVTGMVVTADADLHQYKVHVILTDKDKKVTKEWLQFNAFTEDHAKAMAEDFYKRKVEKIETFKLDAAVKNKGWNIICLVTKGKEVDVHKNKNVFAPTSEIAKTKAIKAFEDEGYTSVTFHSEMDLG